jgi:hypothetical protein
MKAKLLSLAMLPLLLGGCNKVAVKATPAVLYSTQMSTIEVELRNSSNALPNIAQSVILTSSDPAVAGFSADPLTVRSGTPGATPGPGIATATLTAGTVNEDKEVTIDAEWDGSGGMWPDKHGTAKVTVRPSIADSPRNGDRYVSVLPSIVPRWKFTYEIQSRSSAGAPVDLKGCTFAFQVPVTMKLIKATNSSAAVGDITLTVAPGANTSFYIGGGATFVTMIVEATAADASLGGTTTITAHGDDNHDYVIPIGGPQ